MTQRTLSLILAVLVVAAATTSRPGSGPAAAAPAVRPNIIFILTDDQDARSVAFMPKLQTLLASRGVTFANFFVTYPLCCPSRASILRGQYPHNTQILGNRPPLGGFEKFYASGSERSTVATWLQAAGYRTGYFGKYLNGYPQDAAPTYVPPGWDEWYSPIDNRAYTNFDYRMNENGRIVTYGNRPQDYLVDVLAAKAADFIRRSDRPLFIHLATFTPHAPATPAPRHADLFADAAAPRPASFNEPDTTDKPAWLRDRPPLSAREIATLDALYRRRLQSLQAIDDLIAALVDALRAAGALERTFIFYSSDNGFHLGEHRLAPGKNTAYEEDIRVPLIVAGPGVPAGRVVEHLALNTDLAPTWAELAGATPPAFVDGRSLVPLLVGTPPLDDRWRQALLIEHYAQRADQASRRAARAIPGYFAIRTRDVIYIEYADGERELYDLRRDPLQLQNTFAGADSDLVARLAASLAMLRRCAGAGCRAAEETH